MPKKSATHPTRTMRTPQTRNASSVMLGRVRCIPVVEGRENHLVSVVRLLGNRVPKAFMAYAANQPFRSRSLVRTRIGTFRASDAGSNPAGSPRLPEGWLKMSDLFRPAIHQSGDTPDQSDRPLRLHQEFSLPLRAIPARRGFA